MYYIIGISKVTSYFNIFHGRGQFLGLYSVCLDARVEKFISQIFSYYLNKYFKVRIKTIEKSLENKS